MKLRTALFTLALSTFSLVACGGDDVGSGPVSEEDFVNGCKADCERNFECDPTNAQPVAECNAECAGDYADVRGWLRADAFVAITDCFADLACTADEGVCLTECSPTSTHNAYETQCRKVFATCVTEPADLDGFCEVTPMPNPENDDVGFFCLITPDVIQRMLDCIPDGTACDPGLTCIQGVMQSVGLGGA